MRKIETGVAGLPGVSDARLNLTTGRLSVTWQDGRIDPRTIVQRVIDLGYQAQPFDPSKVQAIIDQEGRHRRPPSVEAFTHPDIMVTAGRRSVHS